ncbi:MAG: ORF6N domain-containing protein [Candidatus Omnitrophica bacterium]|nr:ORF6N domain-containing protein [Candidatus Omnitrophota bacterium]
MPHESIQQKIYLIRGHRVMLDSSLAALYQVSTKALLQAVKRNAQRFPGDFMFQLTPEETLNLRSQFVTSSWGGRRYLPYVFTEQGVSMLSSVLKSSRAILVNITIMRVFVELRAVLSTHKELAQKLVELEGKIQNHDQTIQSIFEAIHQIMNPPVEPENPKRKIGFHHDPE